MRAAEESVAAPPLGSVRAFAPCHVTGLVLPATDAPDPRARGSLGAGIVLSVGVHATARWRPLARGAVRVRASDGTRLPISESVARRLIGATPGRFELELRHDLPIGQGFGTSAAGALATGLALSRLLGTRRTKAVEAAHLADLEGGGGLGGVAAILGGGLERRVRPGIPPWGRIERTPYPGRLVVATAGPPLPSPRVLGSRRFAGRFSAAADLLDRLGSPPEPSAFWRLSEAFTQRVGLPSGRLAGVLRGLRRRRVHAAQAMFGRALFAALPQGAAGEEVVRWLRAQGTAPVVCHASARGARLGG